MLPLHPIANTPLRCLPTDLLSILQPDLERVPLVRGQKLEEPGIQPRFVYFLEKGLASVLASISARQTAEVGLIGHEGATGSSLFMRDEFPVHETVVQLEGSALRISAAKFSQHLQQQPWLNTTMLRYARSLWIQSSFTAAANTRATLEIRLGRGLLMMQDRVGSQLGITHEFLGLMLSARRPGITTALHVLEGLHLVQPSRGRLVISDRAGLLNYVGEAYGAPEREYERLLGSPITQPGALP